MNKPSLPLSAVNDINSPGSGLWVDPNLSDENTFDDTVIRSFSLNNAVNGNLGRLLPGSVAVRGVEVAGYFGIKRCYGEAAARASVKVYGLAAGAVTAAVTAYDLGSGLIKNSINQVWDSSAGPAGPGEAYVGDGLILSDPTGFF